MCKKPFTFKESLNEDSLRLLTNAEENEIRIAVLKHTIQCLEAQIEGLKTMRLSAANFVSIKQDLFSDEG